jgi:hypothetical protein
MHNCIETSHLSCGSLRFYTDIAGLLGLGLMGAVTTGIVIYYALQSARRAINHSSSATPFSDAVGMGLPFLGDIEQAPN